jgi:23S rRNA pseudouridine1911/1915/1917 synthase
VRIEIGEELAGQRLDIIVTRVTSLGRAGTRRLFADGKVVLLQDGRKRRVRKGDMAIAGTALEVDVASDDFARADPDPALTLDLVYESETLVIVDKPPGVPSAPIRPGELGTIANGLLARYPEMVDIGFSAREPGLCHRLDTDTSGLLLAARSRVAFDELTTAIRTGAFDKRYLLICPRSPLDESGTIEAALQTEGAKVRIVADGRPATTHYRVLEQHGELALVEASACPATRHQIRAHFSSVGAPLFGDKSYGGQEAPELGRHALHASRLAYAGGPHIAAFTIESALPAELRAVLDGG